MRWPNSWAVVCGVGVCAGAWTAGPAWGAATYALTLTANPNPVVVTADAPAAVNWTVKNTSTSSDGTDNLNLIVDTVRFNVMGALSFFGGDPDNQAYNPEIVNPAKYVGITLASQGTFVFTALTQTRDLSPVKTADIGSWLLFVAVDTHPQVSPTVKVTEASNSRIDVRGVPEPAAGSVATALAVAAAGRRVRRVPTALRTGDKVPLTRGDR